MHVDEASADAETKQYQDDCTDDRLLNNGSPQQAESIFDAYLPSPELTARAKL